MDDNSYVKTGLLYASNKRYLPKIRTTPRPRTRCLCIYLTINSLRNSHDWNRPDIWRLVYTQKFFSRQVHWTKEFASSLFQDCKYRILQMHVKGTTWNKNVNDVQNNPDALMIYPLPFQSFQTTVFTVLYRLIWHHRTLPLSPHNLSVLLLWFSE